MEKIIYYMSVDYTVITKNGDYKIYNYTSRYCYGVPKYTPFEPILEELTWDEMCKKINIKERKSLTGQQYIYLDDWFTYSYECKIFKNNFIKCIQKTKVIESNASINTLIKELSAKEYLEFLSDNVKNLEIIEVIKEHM